MGVTPLIVAGVAVAYALVVGGLLYRWRNARVEPDFRSVRTSIDYDLDNRYPFPGAEPF